jgi:hypothetical protein
MAKLGQMQQSGCETKLSLKQMQELVTKTSIQFLA